MTNLTKAQLKAIVDKAVAQALGKNSKQAVISQSRIITDKAQVEALIQKLPAQPFRGRDGEQHWGRHWMKVSLSKGDAIINDGGIVTRFKDGLKQDYALELDAVTGKTFFKKVA